VCDGPDDVPTSVHYTGDCVHASPHLSARTSSTALSGVASTQRSACAVSATQCYGADFVASQTTSSRDNRSMELSELIKFKHFLLAVCDYTGLVFRIAYGDNLHRNNNLAASNTHPKIFQR
jgi:hypothetical protein